MVLPDLSEAAVEGTVANMVSLGSLGSEESCNSFYCFFPDLPQDVAQRKGIVGNLFEYNYLASATFALRYVAHPHAFYFRRTFPDMDKRRIRALLRNPRELRQWKPIDIDTLRHPQVTEATEEADR